MGRVSVFSGPSPSSPCSQGHNLAESLIISLASVFCITCVYILLNLFCKCVRRRFQATGSRRLHEEPAASVEIDEASIKQLEAIPVIIYSRSTKVCENDIDPEPETCSVCLTEYGNGEKVRMLPNCKHLFHKECIDEWLLRRSSFCPICRDRVVRRDKELVVANCEHDGDHNQTQRNDPRIMTPQQQQVVVNLSVSPPPRSMATM